MKRVLLADASPTARALARLALADTEIELTFAAGGKEALEAVQRHAPDVVLVDAMLPDMEPFELCRRLKEQFADLPLVLAAPDYLALDQNLIAEARITSTLRKPFGRQELLQALTGAVAPSATSLATPGTSAPAPPPNPSAISSEEPNSQLETAQLSALAEQLAHRLIEAMLPILLERLREPLRAEIESRLAAEVGRSIRESLPAIVSSELPQALLDARELIEPVVWKTVPALAEQFIKEEITRLTEEEP